VVDAEAPSAENVAEKTFFIVRSSPNNYDGVTMMVMVVMVVTTMVIRLRVSRSRDEGKEGKCHYLLHAQLDARVARPRAHTSSWRSFSVTYRLLMYGFRCKPRTKGCGITILLFVEGNPRGTR
jgi:hypothetical protein